MNNAKQYTDQNDLNKTLWSACDTFRGTIDAGQYKDYILVFLFYKYMSDKHNLTIQKLKEQYGDDENRIQRKLSNERFNIPAGTSFNDIYNQMEDDSIGTIINKALHKIEDSNNKLHGIFTNIDFNSDSNLGTTRDRNRRLMNLIKDFAKINLGNVKDDIIGESYIYLISKFGSDAGKKAGEFFTPRQVSKILAKLASPKSGDRICDLACGSGSLLLLAGEEVEAKGSNDYSLYGQEVNGSTYQLARMNMFLHNKDDARLEWGDTLNNPQLLENDSLIKFDIVVANPPFSLKKWGAENAEGDKYNRFHRGVPPKDKGDYAFVTHMIETAKSKSGRVAVIVPHGVLFRGGAEGKIRQQLIDENLLDTVVGLPAGLFSTTGIPVAILVFDRSREVGGANESKKDVLFIDASKEFNASKKQNTLEDEHIKKILDAVEKRSDIDKYSHLAKLDEIKENDYNLNIPRYVDTFEEEDEIILADVQKDLKEIDSKIIQIEDEMNKHLKELGDD